MLKIIANIYSDNKDNFDKLVASIKKEGYEMAYSSTNSGVVLEEVEDLEDNN